MLNKPVPIGNMKVFEGDITKIDKNAFGFFEAIVTTPTNLNIPVLQIHHNDRTLSPVGKFKGSFLVKN
jgi:hypothetical protein